MNKWINIQFTTKKDGVMKRAKRVVEGGKYQESEGVVVTSLCDLYHLVVTGLISNIQVLKTD